MRDERGKPSLADEAIALNVSSTTGWLRTAVSITGDFIKVRLTSRSVCSCCGACLCTGLRHTTTGPTINGAAAFVTQLSTSFWPVSAARGRYADVGSGAEIDAGFPGIATHFVLVTIVSYDLDAVRVTGCEG